VTSSTAEGQSQAAEPPIQVLRQRVHQLVDTVYTTQRRCDELSRQDVSGRSQQQALAAQLTALTQERDRLKSERDALAGSQQELTTQRDGLQAERNALQAERDALSTQLQTFSSQRDGLQQERDQLSTERDAMAASQEQLGRQHDDLLQHRDSLKTQVEELQFQLNAQSAQSAEQSQQREALQARVEELQNQYHDAIKVEHDKPSRETEAQKAQYETMQADIMTAKKELERKTVFFQSCLAQSSVSSHIAKVMLLSIMGSRLSLATLLASPKPSLELEE